MRQTAGFALLLALLWGCSHTVVVPVPPRMDLKSFGTLGLVEFASNSDASINARATREFFSISRPTSVRLQSGNKRSS